MKTCKSSLLYCLAVAVVALSWGIDPGWAKPVTQPGMTPDYFETPNWANSPALAKFVDPLPGLYVSGVSPAPAAGTKYIPVAVPDQTTYSGSDYYEIEVGQYTEKMHRDLQPTTLRGYRQTNTTDAAVSQFHYLGPVIIGTKDRPVRVKFTNSLGTGAAGNLFVPVDTTVMGSGPFEINYDPTTKAPGPTVTGTFTQNRATLHLHGGKTPWISDGTPHQWITPAGESTSYPKGVSVENVPDMWFNAAGSTIAGCAGQTSCAAAGATNDPGAGSQTFYWTNQQSSRLMFYHDHAWGITRLNVYVGEAAGYVITDQTETDLATAGVLPADVIPLIIQDKTFVDGNPASPTYVRATDPLWNWGTGAIDPVTGFRTPQTGDLWWPHVYMPAQNPYNPDMSGVNAMGRWMYGPWFWPPTSNIPFGPVVNPYYGAANPLQPPYIPGTPDVSWGAEAFLDTMVVNGAAFPTVTVDPKAYRLRVLNAAHDRFLNLQLYVAAAATANPAAFSGYDYALCDGAPGAPTTGCTEVKMVPAGPTPAFPANWPTDGREGGVPDPATSGPDWIQIGTEGGFLPQPAVIPNLPVTFNLDPTMFNVGNVIDGTIRLGCAERADVIIDFSAYAGKTLILYNDAPAAYPALDPHYDYYTGNPDRQDMGGHSGTLAGFGPNIRTVMQITVANTAPAAPYNLAALQTAFNPAAPAQGVFARGQAEIIVGQSAYDAAYKTTFPAVSPNWGISTIFNNSLSFQKVDGTLQTLPMRPKAIHDEMGAVYDDYGRMSAKLGLEVPFSTNLNQTFIMQNYIDPPTEIAKNGEVQIWKISHNGVDTHPIHFHLFDVQLINRVGWDGFIRLPDPNELGWKDTLKISPLEDTIVALRPTIPTVPFSLPNSIRPLNPAAPLGDMMGFTNLDQFGQALNPPVSNIMYNFGHEYVWHCHILSHEENDMMRSIVVNNNPPNDILWRNTAGNGENALWAMDGTTHTGTQWIDGVPDQAWTIVGRADFNGDGQEDILWRHISGIGENLVWYMSGTTHVGNGWIISMGDQSWKMVGIGDFNGDKKPDILWRNSTTGENVVWYMDGSTLTGSVWLDPIADQSWVVAGTGDFNNDGRPDILWRNTAGAGENVVWLMNGITRTGSVWLTPLADQNWKVAKLGDFNSDINDDILWRNSATGENMVWFMTGTTQFGTGALTTIPTEWIIVDK